MDIILKTDIAGLGYKNDILNVKPGYARNFLIPKGFATMATDTNKKILAENMKQAAHKVEKLITEAQNLAAKIAETEVKIAMKVGESGRIFGRVTSIQISDALSAQGIEVDRKKIAIAEVKFVGEYTAIADLHKLVKQDIKVSVVAEEVVA
jgi:large subunit ribosomal protein L9